MRFRGHSAGQTGSRTREESRAREISEVQGRLQDRIVAAGVGCADGSVYFLVQGKVLVLEKKLNSQIDREASEAAGQPKQSRKERQVEAA